MGDGDSEKRNRHPKIHRYVGDIDTVRKIWRT